MRAHRTERLISLAHKFIHYWTSGPTPEVCPALGGERGGHSQVEGGAFYCRYEGEWGGRGGRVRALLYYCLEGAGPHLGNRYEEGQVGLLFVELLIYTSVSCIVHRRVK